MAGPGVPWCFGPVVVHCRVRVDTRCGDNLPTLLSGRSSHVPALPCLCHGGVRFKRRGRDQPRAGIGEWRGVHLRDLWLDFVLQLMRPEVCCKEGCGHACRSVKTASQLQTRRHGSTEYQCSSWPRGQPRLSYGALARRRLRKVQPLRSAARWRRTYVRGRKRTAVLSPQSGSALPCCICIL